MSEPPHLAYVIEPSDLPWTAQLPVWVVVLGTIASAGALFVALGAFLAFWIRRRFRNGVAWMLYLLQIALSLILWIHLPALVENIGAWLVCCISIAAAFALRRDVERYFQLRHGSRVEMNPMWTLIFGPGYVNYTLAVLFNGERATGPSGTTIFPSR